MECFVKKIKGTVSGDEFPYFNGLVLNLGIGTIVLSHSYQRSLTYTLLSGTLYKSDGETVALNAGESWTQPSTENQETRKIISGTGKLLINDIYELGRFELSSGDFDTMTKPEDFSLCPKLYKLSGRGDNWQGRIEDYVKKSIYYEKTSEIEISGNNLTFNGTSTASQTYKIEYNTNGATVSKKVGGGSYSVVGTYATATDTWTYV